MGEPLISFCAPKHLVKTIKTKLEEHGQLSSTRKIVQSSSTEPTHRDFMIIPTRISAAGISITINIEKKLSILATLGLEDYSHSVECIVEFEDDRADPLGRVQANPLIKAVKLGLESLPLELFQEANLGVELLLSKFPSTYSLYPPLLLLPNHVFATMEWEQVFYLTTPKQMQWFYQSIASSMNITHIAMNAPIPRLNGSQRTSMTEIRDNIIRSPTNLKTLYGNFGSVVNSLTPSIKDFHDAFWVSTQQNGINQVWAPRYTMFSRGNISEKARILTLPSVEKAVRQGQVDGRGCAAVDLYAGIGYFSFSYAKAGLSKIYCWELNPWSVEGFRRGAGKQKWGTRIVEEENVSESTLKDDSTTFLIFQMDNAKAARIVERARGPTPPIRHVNCGLLPTSRGSWETAVRVLDEDMGGWIHLHENIATGAIQTKSNDILEDIQRILDSMSSIHEESGRRKLAVLEHVETVKTYAPGVMHCVLDIYISS